MNSESIRIWIRKSQRLSGYRFRKKKRGWRRTNRNSRNKTNKIWISNLSKWRLTIWLFKVEDENLDEEELLNRAK